LLYSLGILILAKVFEVACDVWVCHWRRANQKGHPIAFFSEKVNDSRRVKYTTFEKELYALLLSLRH